MKINDNEIKINIDSAITLANLSVEAREDYLSFVSDFIDYMNMINRKNVMFKKENKHNFEVDDFLALCQRKIIGNKDIKIKSPLKLYYMSLINNHKIFLGEILENIVGFYKLYYNGTLADMELSERFVDYLNSVNDFDLIVKNNLESIKKIGIDKITLREGENLDANYTMSVIKNPNKFEDNDTRYMVIGTISDGNIINEDKLDDNTYTYDVDGASYIIRFTKGTLCNDEVDMILNSLIFDSKSLPSREVLTDLRVLPNIDFRKIDLQCKGIEMLCSYEDVASLSSELNDKLEKLLKLLSSNDCNMEYLEILMHIHDFQKLNQVLQNRRHNFSLELSEYIPDEKIKNLKAKRLCYRENREKYLGHD